MRVVGPSEVAGLGAEILADADGLAEQMAARIHADVPAYRDPDLMSPDLLTRSCREHIKVVGEALVESRAVDTEHPRANGRLRAHQGVPLADLMQAYRSGSRWLWDHLAVSAEEQGVPAEVLVNAASQIWGVQADFIDAMVAGYRDYVAQEVLHNEERAAALVEALLEGTLTEGLMVYEVADLLGLSHTSPYVVVAAEVPDLATHRLIGMRARLASLDLASAWRLLPDLHVGIVSVDGPAQLNRLVGHLRKYADHRVGISPAREGLGDAAKGLRLARIAMLSAIPDNVVTVFDEDLPGVATVASPEVMTRLTDVVLAGLDDVSDDERELLLATFRTWAACGGSVAEAAQLLYCHPNTVRHRLHRLEERTGRSVSDPRSMVELYLAAGASYRR